MYLLCTVECVFWEQKHPRTIPLLLLLGCKWPSLIREYLGPTQERPKRCGPWNRTKRMFFCFVVLGQCFVGKYCLAMFLFSLACSHFHHAHKEREAYNIGTSSTTATTTSSSTVVLSTDTFTTLFRYCMIYGRFSFCSVLFFLVFRGGRKGTGGDITRGANSYFTFAPGILCGLDTHIRTRSYSFVLPTVDVVAYWNYAA